jgi:pimeloyl-ACP methyl ester carboxylesterase
MTRRLLLLNPRRRAMLILILGIGLAAYAGVCLFFLNAQRSFIYYPRPKHNPAASQLILPRNKTDVQIACHPCDGPRGLVYFGGNAEDVSLSLPETAAAFPGWAIYILYYRGYGGSSGKPTEAGLREDAAAVFEFVSKRHTHVTLIGRSLGSSLAVGLAATHNPQRLVLITPFDSMLAIASQIAPYLPMQLLLRDRWESVKSAPRVHCPTLILAAGDDELIPAANTDCLLRAFPDGVASLSVIPDADHNSIAVTPEFWQALRAFVADGPSQADEPLPIK